MVLIGELQNRFMNLVVSDEIDLDLEESGKQGASTDITFTMGAIPKENTFITSKFLDIKAA